MRSKIAIALSVLAAVVSLLAAAHVAHSCELCSIAWPDIKYAPQGSLMGKGYCDGTPVKTFYVFYAEVSCEHKDVPTFTVFDTSGNRWDPSRAQLNHSYVDGIYRLQLEVSSEFVSPSVPAVFYVAMVSDHGIIIHVFPGLEVQFQDKGKSSYIPKILDYTAAVPSSTTGWKYELRGDAGK